MSKLFLNSPFMLGFDAVENALEQLSSSNDKYPPYNIEAQGEEKIFIKIAVAGFLEDELEVYQEDNQLIVSGTKKEEPLDTTYLYKGISTRKFKKSFVIAQGVEPIFSFLENGILVIELKKELPKKNIKKILIGKKA